MKAILLTEIDGIRLYLNEQGLATDRIERVKAFRDWTDAWWHACQENVDPGWSKFGIRWHPTYVLHSGDIVEWKGGAK